MNAQRARWGCVVNATHRTLYPLGNNPITVAFYWDFNQTWIFSTDFLKILKYEIHENPSSRSRFAPYDRQMLSTTEMMLNIIFSFYGFKTCTYLRTEEASNTPDNSNGFAHNQCAQLSVRHAHTWWHHLPPRVPNDACSPPIHATPTPRCLPQADANLKSTVGRERRAAVCQHRDVIRRQSADPKKTVPVCHSIDVVLSEDTLGLLVLH
jgi:hypothetical protein